MRKMFIYGCLVMMSGCASVTKGVNQSVAVNTIPAKATCKLTNSKGTWYVTTPGSAYVHRAYGDLKVACEKDGYQLGTKKVKSKTSAHVAGNVLIPGSIILAGVDAIDGAAYDYPDEIIVPLKPIKTAQQSEKTVVHHEAALKKAKA